MPVIEYSDRDWREDWAGENGQYICRCSQCQQTFIGYKRRVICKACAYTGLDAEAQALRKEVAALRAGVVVVPARRQWGGVLPTAENLKTDGFNECLDELARLNGKAVSEGLLRNVLNHHAAARAELEALLGEGKKHE